MTINTENANDDSYARIVLSGPGCAFLTEGWCGIQKKLGEQYLSIMCSQYPRVMNVVDDVLQRSLDLSCPEAARLMLLDPDPMQFDEQEGPPRDSRHGSLSVLRTSDDNSNKPYKYFREIRDSSIWLLQYRTDPLWKRLTILGSLCDQLQAEPSTTLEALEAYRAGVERDRFGAALRTHRAQPAKQLELVIELIIGRISSDFTGPRLLACYQKFMDSMNWTADLSMEGLGARYAAAHSQHYEPFMNHHPHILEHYLVNYVHRTLFPLGPQESTRGLSIHHAASTVRDQCLLMMVHYAIIQMLLIGMAAFHKEQFGINEVIQVIQSYTKAFEHSLSFPERALKVLAEKGVKSCTELAILVMN